MSSYAHMNEGIAHSEDWAALCKGTPAEIYSMTWAATNVYGVVIGSTAPFRAKVCPLLGLNDQRLDKIMVALEEAHHFVPFVAEGKRWFWLPSWNRQNDVRWDAVGKPDTPLPDEWVMPEALRDVLEHGKETDKLKRLRRYFSSEKYCGMWSSERQDHSLNGFGTDTVQDQDGSGTVPKLTRNSVRAGGRVVRASAGDGESDSEGDAGEPSVGTITRLMPGLSDLEMAVDAFLTAYPLTDFTVRCLFDEIMGVGWLASQGRKQWAEEIVRFLSDKYERTLTRQDIVDALKDEKKRPSSRDWPEAWVNRVKPPVTDKSGVHFETGEEQAQALRAMDDAHPENVWERIPGAEAAIGTKCYHWGVALYELGAAVDPRFRALAEEYHLAHVAYRQTLDADAFPDCPAQVVTTE